MSRSHRPALILCLVVFGLHLAWLSRFYSGDAIYYALMFQEPEWASPNFMLPQHPAWNVLGTAVFHAYKAVGYSGGALELSQVMNAMVGAVALYWFYLLLLELRSSGPLALLLAAWLGVSWCFWFYSSDVKMYAWVSLLIFASLALALRLARRGPEAPARDFVALGLVTAALMMFHVTAYYLVPVIAVALVARPSGWGDRLRKGFLFGGVFAAAVLLGYYLSFLPLKAGHYNGTFLEWVTSPARAAYPGLLQQLSFEENFGFFWRRFSNSVTGGTWYREPVGAKPAWWLPLDSISRAYFPAWLGAWALLALPGVPAAFRKLPLESRFCTLWLLPALAGYVLASPDSDFVFSLLYPLLAWTGLFLTALLPPEETAPRRRAAYGVLGGLAAVLFALNAVLRWIPATDPQNNPELVKARVAAQVLGPEDLLVSHKDSSYFAYFTKCRTLDLYLAFQGFWNHPTTTPLQYVEAEIGRARLDGRRVFLNGDIFTDDFRFFPMPPAMGFDRDVIVKFFRDHYSLQEIQIGTFWTLFALPPEKGMAAAEAAPAVPLLARIRMEPPQDPAPALPDHEPPLYRYEGLVLDVEVGALRLRPEPLLTADGRLGQDLGLPAGTKALDLVRLSRPGYGTVELRDVPVAAGRVDLGEVTLRSSR